MDQSEMAPPDNSVTASPGQDILLGYYPQRTKVIAAISGWTKINDGIRTYVYTLEGHYSAGGAVSLYSDLQGLASVDIVGLQTMTATIDVAGAVMLGQRKQIIFEGMGGEPWTMTGQSTASVTLVHATLGIGARYRYPYTMDSISLPRPGVDLRLLPRSVEGNTLAAADPGSWVFVPDNGGPTTTPACRVVTRTYCDVAPMVSGTMTMFGYANANPRASAKIHIKVQETNKLTVECLPSTPTRGEVVKCTATMTPKKGFTITHRRATAPGYLQDDQQAQASPTGAPYVWQGKAVLPTTVTMTATLDDGSGVVMSETASFGITPRRSAEWLTLQLPFVRPDPKYVDKKPLVRDPFPGVAAGEVMRSPDGALGVTVLTTRKNWTYVNDGPNGHLFFAGTPLDTAAAAAIYVHSWLERGSEFYRKQQGTKNPVIGIRDCRGSDIDVLRNRVIEHENRHWDINVSSTATQRSPDGSVRWRHSMRQASSTRRP